MISTRSCINSFSLSLSLLPHYYISLLEIKWSERCDFGDRESRKIESKKKIPEESIPIVVSRLRSCFSSTDLLRDEVLILVTLIHV